MPNTLVTGSNRGLGLEWVRQYASLGWRVFATCRHPEEATELIHLARDFSSVSVHRLDVTTAADIAALSHDLRHETIDVLINNAGVYLEKFAASNIGQVNYDEWEYTFKVNSIGAFRVTEAFLEQIAHSQRRLIVAITSHMGSISEISNPGDYLYRSSKAALNAAMKGLALELRPRDIGVLLLHPGWVQTRMGGPGARYTPEESVRGMRALIDHFTLAMSGQFYRFNGSVIPW